MHTNAKYHVAHTAVGACMWNIQYS